MQRIAVSLMCLLILVACSGSETTEETPNNTEELGPLVVDLSVPDTGEIGEPIMFSTAVTQGDEGVEDANEVVYEIWLEGSKEESELIETDKQDGHLYMLQYTFEVAGTYHVQTHVTARGMHQMPTEQIRIQ